MNLVLKGVVAAALISVSASVFGAAVAEASPKTDTQGQTGSKVDKDGTRGTIDRDGTQGEFSDATHGEWREATQGEMSGPQMSAVPGFRAG